SRFYRGYCPNDRGVQDQPVCPRNKNPLSCLGQTHREKVAGIAKVNSPPADPDLVFDAAALRERVISVLSTRGNLENVFRNIDCTGARTSSVLLLLAQTAPVEGGVPEVCIILNKRSKEVQQPGDLCCPGGAVENFDRFLSRLLSFRGSSLSKWPCWDELKTGQHENARFLSLLYAASLRESWE